MTKIQLLEREVKKLDRNSLGVFRDWFRHFDAEAWDRQLERDARSGKLGKLAEEALVAHNKNGKTREL